MRVPASIVLTVGAVMLAGCGAAELRQLTEAGALRKAAYNDFKARAAMTATCDVSVGAYFRQLTDAERILVAQVCNPEAGNARDLIIGRGWDGPPTPPQIERLEAPEP